ncbi:Coenzyme Q-binding protein COQ10 like protein, mitochondrial [Mycena sanguinolenta]|uniref:Coenzyme Q-binding protein COQ10 like protein, mitochondrial n=1 Tax=Mycena sanguinolenta TaxID=230812 RepID=A0A8H6YA78_9AGAR|nr:Coenzyme Q-binding protein COQ10 like protein, mitochondrial [Mycena sanguinolenta]
MLRVSRPGLHRLVSTRRRQLFSLPDLSNILPGGSELQTYREQKSLPYTRQQLYKIVSDVGSYHHFIPFCSASRVLSTTDETQSPILMDAELTVEFLAFKESYVSRVTCIPLESVQAVASSATPLFKELTTMWRFQSISESGAFSSSDATASPTTLVKLDLSFAFASPIHAAISSSFFGQVSKLMVNAFEERCAEVYGPK